MSVEEMASDEMKKLRDRYAQESILDHQMLMQEGTPTDMFTCGKCRQKNCTYTQVSKVLPNTLKAWYRRVCLCCHSHVTMDLWFI